MTTSAWGGSFGEAPNSAWGDSFGFEGFVAPTQTTTIPAGGGKALHRESYLSWWEREWARIRAERGKKKKLPAKKRKLVEELDEAVVELKAQLAERESTEAYTRELQQEVLAAASLVNQAYQDAVSVQKLRVEIARFEEYLREMDDEETILLALH